MMGIVAGEKNASRATTAMLTGVWRRHPHDRASAPCIYCSGIDRYPFRLPVILSVSAIAASTPPTTIIDAMPRYYAEFESVDVDGVMPWRSLRPWSPDGVPTIGRTAKFSNLCIATGHSMMGASLGPITSKIMSEMLLRRATAVRHGATTPDRYG